MKKKWDNKITFILFALVTVFSSFSYILFKKEMDHYSKGAALSTIEVSRSLEEFETLIEKETEDYTYYNDIAAGFVPALNYHIVTSDKFVLKYEKFYWETYNPLRDSIRKAANSFTKVDDKASYEKAKKVFKQELKKYKEAIKTLEEKELK